MLALYGHLFSSYTWKALIPLYANGTNFEFRPVDPDHPRNALAVQRGHPAGKFPLLVDGDTTVFEATAIVEYLAVRTGPAPLIPADPLEAVTARMLDRVFDNYVMTPMQKIVADYLRPEKDRDPYGVAEAKTRLGVAYGWLDKTLAGRDWAVGGAFSAADCAAAPALFYADWVHPIDTAFANLKGYRQRLLARPSFARAVDEARPYRRHFPPGAPDRD